MIISILKKNKASGPALTKEAVSDLVQHGHTVLVEGVSKEKALKPYLNVGAYIIDSKEELLDRGELIVKKAFPEVKEIDYVDGEEKIFFAHLNFADKQCIEKILEHRISVINYFCLPGIHKKKIDINHQVSFSKYILPFLRTLADRGMKALVDDEPLRGALSIMHGRVYDTALARRYRYDCYEF